MSSGESGGTVPTSNARPAARDQILARIRTANTHAGVAGMARAEPASPAETSSGAVKPTGSTPTGDALVQLFAERVADYRAEVTVVAEAARDAGAVAEAVAAALGDAATVVVPGGVPAHWLARAAARQIADDDLAPDALDRVDAVVTGAALGIAVTGTIVLDHAAAQGRRALSLVPDLHVCVVREDQLVPDVPEAMAVLDPAVRAGRPLTWISGPSATSDIELNRVEGVHGPRTLRVIVLRG
ncbi:LutC/YkgG family protein [Flexivirga meconopsidis]|uniref:LutC/YkgG family protein n=1 Tax=Flexivirga meconopsidis TaxID=2977121 RepID=UPI002240B496|nr:LUD domain-containing protein [Flexivirga meconopsidis]